MKTTANIRPVDETTLERVADLLEEAAQSIRGGKEPTSVEVAMELEESGVRYVTIDLMLWLDDEDDQNVIESTIKTLEAAYE